MAKSTYFKENSTIVGFADGHDHFKFGPCGHCPRLVDQGWLASFSNRLGEEVTILFL